MSRREAREKAMQLLYQLDSQLDSPIQQVEDFLAQRTPLPGATTDIEDDDENVKSTVIVLEEDDRVYLRNLVLQVLEKQDDLDSSYRKYLKKWTPERLPRLERVLLRMGVYEIQFSEEVPDSVAISEIVRLSKKYTEKDSYSYINAVLGNVSRMHNNENELVVEEKTETVLDQAELKNTNEIGEEEEEENEPSYEENC